MSTSKCKLRPNKDNHVAGTSTNKAGATAVETPAVTGAVVATAARVIAAVEMVVMTAAPAAGPAAGVEVMGMVGAGVVETAGVPTPTIAATTNEHEQV